MVDPTNGNSPPHIETRRADDNTSQAFNFLARPLEVKSGEPDLIPRLPILSVVSVSETSTIWWSVRSELATCGRHRHTWQSHHVADATRSLGGASQDGPLATGTGACCATKTMLTRDNRPVGKLLYAEILDLPRQVARNTQFQHLIEIAIIESPVPSH